MITTQLILIEKLCPSKRCPWIHCSCLEYAKARQQMTQRINLSSCHFHTEKNCSECFSVTFSELSEHALNETKTQNTCYPGIDICTQRSYSVRKRKHLLRLDGTVYFMLTTKNHWLRKEIYRSTKPSTKASSQLHEYWSVRSATNRHIVFDTTLLHETASQGFLMARGSLLPCTWTTLPTKAIIISFGEAFSQCFQAETLAVVTSLGFCMMRGHFPRKPALQTFCLPQQNTCHTPTNPYVVIVLGSGLQIVLAKMQITPHLVRNYLQLNTPQTAKQFAVAPDPSFPQPCPIYYKFPSISAPIIRMFEIQIPRLAGLAETNT